MVKELKSRIKEIENIDRLIKAINKVDDSIIYTITGKFSDELIADLLLNRQNILDALMDLSELSTMDLSELGR
jgi:hypothetical protein